MIFAVFDENDRYKVASGLWQYAFGQSIAIQGLKLPSVVSVDFSLDKTGLNSEPRIGVTKDGITEVPIPDSFLINGNTTSDYTVYVFISIINDKTGNTEYRIDLPIKSRPKPKTDNKNPEDAQIFREAMRVVSESAVNARESEKQAKLSADNAREDAVKTDADRKAVEELVKQTSNIGAQVEEVKQNAQKAVESARNAKASETNASTSETNAKTSEAKASASETNAKASEQAVEQAKTSVDKSKQAVDETVARFNQSATEASQALNNEKEAHLQAITGAGTSETKKVTDEGTKQVGAVQTTGTAETGKVTSEGTKQVGAVRTEAEKHLQTITDATNGIVADRQQIGQNKADTTQLKEALTNLNGKVNSYVEIKEPINYFNVNSELNKKNTFYNDGNTFEGDAFPDYKVSHPIKVTKNQSYKFTYSNRPYGDICAFAYVDEKNNVLSYSTTSFSEGFAMFTAKQDGFVSINYTINLEDKVMFCKTEKYPTAYHPYNDSELFLNEKIIVANIKSILKGKKILYNGDSICEERYNVVGNNGGAYSKKIADLTGCIYENRAIGGGTIAISRASHNIVKDVENMSATADIVCFEGGINDYWQNVPLGTFSESDFTGVLDEKTVCGALESILRQALNKWVGVPICFILTHKIKPTVYKKNEANYTFMEQHDIMIKILNKYSIPYLDLFTCGGLNAYIDTLNDGFLNGGSNAHPDGCHPDENGYKKYYVRPIIKMFESILPID